MTPFICRHGDPRCKTDPCPAGIAWMCNAPIDHPARRGGPSTEVRHALVQRLEGERRRGGRIGR